jgi:hypothetical protein
MLESFKQTSLGRPAEILAGQLIPNTGHEQNNPRQAGHRLAGVIALGQVPSLTAVEHWRCRSRSLADTGLYCWNTAQGFSPPKIGLRGCLRDASFSDRLTPQPVCRHSNSFAR